MPHPFQYFTTPVTPIDPGALGVPTTYLVSVDDIALPPGEFAWAPRFPERLGVAAVPIPGSHEALFTDPDSLAAALLDT